MSHNIHKINGLILDINVYKESGQIIKIFTEELGLITLIADGIRENKAKLKYNLQILNYCELDFVEGREVKRLTGVKEINNFKKILEDRDKRKIYSNITLLLQRLLIEEVASENLYIFFINFIKYLLEHKYKLELEILAVINILFWTGYWHQSQYLELNDNNLQFVFLNKEKLIKEINQAIKSTHL